MVITHVRALIRLYWQYGYDGRSGNNLAFLICIRAIKHRRLIDNQLAAKTLLPPPQISL